jgi:hypothetical protein
VQEYELARLKAVRPISEDGYAPPDELRPAVDSYKLKRLALQGLAILVGWLLLLIVLGKLKTLTQNLLWGKKTVFVRFVPDRAHTHGLLLMRRR